MDLPHRQRIHFFALFVRKWRRLFYHGNGVGIRRDLVRQDKHRAYENRGLS